MNDMTEVTGTALALPEPVALAALFQTPDKIAALIASVEAEARAHVPDLTTKKGRDAIASLAHKVARSKTALDSAGKDLNADLRAKISVVDEERRKIRDRLDALKSEVRKPLDEWEAAEQARLEALKARLDRLSNAAPAEDTSESIMAIIARVEATVIDDAWAEYLPHAAKAKDATLARLRKQLVATKAREDQVAELERLRAEAAAREEADRIRREAEEAEVRRIAAEKAEAERAAQIEREKQEAAAEAEARAKAEADRLAQEAAARESALAREKQEAEERHARELSQAKAREEAAAQAERDRIEAERKAEADAAEKRRADADHANRIKAAIRDALVLLTASYGDDDMHLAADIAIAIYEGQIPHVKAVL